MLHYCVADKTGDAKAPDHSRTIKCVPRRCRAMRQNLVVSVLPHRWKPVPRRLGAGSDCKWAMACVLPLFVIHPVIRLTCNELRDAFHATAQHLGYRLAGKPSSHVAGRARAVCAAQIIYL